MKNSKERLELIEQLMEIRSNWTFEDFKESYLDEWEEMPKTLLKSIEAMREHIYHKYETDYIKECIENEMN